MKKTTKYSLANIKIGNFTENRIYYLTLLFLYIISITRLIYCNATYSSLAWWTILFSIIVVMVYKQIIIRSESDKIDAIGVLSIIIAGFLTIQLNQPLFSPIISEYNKIDTRNEYSLYWPRGVDEKFDMKSYVYSSYQITVLPPLFPLNNNFVLDVEEKIDTSMVYSISTEIKGPVVTTYKDSIKKFYTSSDGFTIKSARLYFKTKSEMRFQDELDIKIRDYDDIAWSKLEKNELDYISKRFFSNRIDLHRYLNNLTYKKEIEKTYNLFVNNNSIGFNTEEPDFFEIEICNLEIINKSKENQFLNFLSKGFYPRFFFIRPLDKESKNLSNLQSGVMILESNQTKELNILELKYRRPFNQIFPLQNK